MTYSEVVQLIGEPDKIAETYPNGRPFCYEWKLKDGNTLQIRLEYPGTYINRDRERSRKYPDDFVVAHCIIINESLVPTTQPSTDPT